MEALAARPAATAKPAAKKPDPFIRDIEKRMKEKYGAPVKITDKAISISYTDVNDLNRLLEILGMIE